MKKIALILVITALSSCFSFGKMQVFFQYSFFNIPGQDPYVETYLTAIGKSVKFAKNTNNKFQASLLVTILFKQEGQVKTFKKYNLLSPEIDDTLRAFPNFIDQQRIPVPAGIYNFELIIGDNNNNSESYSYKDIFNISFPTGEITFSGIQFLEKYEQAASQTILTKNGYDLYPYVSDFYPDNMNKLIFYTELYQTSEVLKNDEFLIKYAVMTGAKNTPLPDFSRFKKVKPQPVQVLLAEFDIEKLPSGNYFLSVEAVSKENKVLASKKIFFQRSKTSKPADSTDYASVDYSYTFVASITNKDTLKDYIRCLRPVSNEAEKRFVDNLMRSDSVPYMQQFFYNFWQTRNFSNPEGEWLNYYQQVLLVNRLFKTQVLKGYESDRGRVYLQYGSPNSINENKFDPVAYPNEIWHYYNLRSQSNIKFVFYNPNISSKDFSLLHSDLRGEIQNSKWENVIYSRHEGVGIPTNSMQGNEHFSGGNSSTGSVNGRMEQVK